MQNARSNYYAGLSGSVKDRYDVKIEKCGGIDPYTIKDRDLSVDRIDFPNVTLLDIGNHLIYSQSPFTKQQFKAYKSMNAYKYFESGFVLCLGAKKINDLIILKGKVKHSQKMNDSPLRAWILTNNDGEIHCAHCTCLSGLSETCSHIGAICFAIVSINESSESKSVTDVLCKWNVPKFKDVSMSTVKDIKWRTPKEEESASPQHLDSSFVSYVNSLNFLDDETIMNFINTIHSDCEEPAIRTIMYPYDIRRNSNLKDEVFLASIYNKSNATKSRHELVEMGKSTPLLISKDEVNEIARITISKKKSKFWMGLRRGRVTGSVFKGCCVTSIENPSITTINRIMNPSKNLNFVSGLKNQLKKKKKAIDQYVKEALATHKNFKYKECGLLTNQKTPYFASSTDGLVTCDCHGAGCIEIKYLMNVPETTNDSFDVLTRKPYNILNKIGDKYVLEETHAFFYKIQMAINLSEVGYCDVIILTPKNDPLVLKTNVDINFWDTEKQKALTFHEEVVMPELLGKFYTRTTDLPNSTEQSDEGYLELDELYLDQGCFEVEEEDYQKEKENIEIENLEIEKTDSEIEEQHFKLVGLHIELLATQSPKHEKKPNKNRTKSKKKGDKPPRSQLFFKTRDDGTIRNLMNASIEEIFATFAEHEIILTELYRKQIKQLKRNYKSSNVPDMIALDIVNSEQIERMVDFLERKLVRDLEKEHNSSDVIFDSILPEWALLIFCNKFNFNRSEAILDLKLQLQTAIKNMSDSD